MNSAAPSTTATAGGSMPSDPDCVWFYLSADGQQCGPVTPADIADLLIDRDINSKTLGWRNGLPSWVPLSSLPELKGIFATAHDADEVASAGKQQQQPQQKGGARKAGAANNQAAATSDVSAAAASAATLAQPADPLAFWYYTDRSHQQHGPVRADEIVRLYGLCVLSDASLVCHMAPPGVSAASSAAAASAPSAAASSTAASTSASGASAGNRQTPAGSWLRLGEIGEFEGILGPELLERYADERQRLKEQEAKKAADKEKKRKRQQESKSKNPSTSVYVSGLPPDVTQDEVFEVMRKGGIIVEDQEGNRRIKLYKDETGRNKGDALVTYALPDSVELAITLLDQSVFRAAKPPPPPSAASASEVKDPRTEVEKKDWIISVSKANFQPKAAEGNGSKAKSASNDPTESDPQAKRLKAVAAATSHEIAKQRLRESLSWDDDEAAVHSSKLRIVILKPLFNPTQAAAHPGGSEAFYAELKEEVRDELESQLGGGEAGLAERGGRGCIEKLTVFEENPEGPAAVKFRSSRTAADCIRRFNGRFFAGSKLQAFYFDGKTNYVVKRKEETEEEEAKRLKEFGDWLESQADDTEMR